jgi:Raf kinase inhibitor-like YbhB/YbcL family protein
MFRLRGKSIALLLMLVLYLCCFQNFVFSEAEEDKKMKLLSPAFGHEDFIPKKFTCQGNDINPPLVIENIPEGTKSLALIMDDPDAPGRGWVHWVLYDIPVTSEIKENSIPGKEGMNDFGRKHYGGPCPPSGVHRYFFKIYALNKMLDLKGTVDKYSLENAIEPHILDEAELVGLYEKMG